MDIIRTWCGQCKYTLRRQNLLMLRHVETSSVTKSDFVVGIQVTSKTLPAFLAFFILTVSFHISHGLIYDNCDNRTVQADQERQADQKTLHFAVILAATEKNDQSNKCEILNWNNLRNLLAIQWVVNKLNTPNKNNQKFISGYNIEFHVFDDCGQPDIVFKHITDILEPSLTTHFNECPKIPKRTYPHFFAILTLGNASVTDTILEVAKTVSIPVVNPKVNLDSFKKYRNFISLSALIDFQAQAILKLLQKLKWTYSGIIYSNTEFGQQMKNRLMSNAVTHGICFAFNENTSSINRIDSKISSAIKKVKAEQLSIVYLGQGSDMEIIFRKTNPKIHWMIFDSFGGHFKTFQAIPNELKGTLTLYPVNVKVNEFEILYTEKIGNLTSRQNVSQPIDHWINDLLYRTNQKLTNIPTVDTLRDDVSSVMDAVYVLATAKREMCSKIPASCTKSNQPYFNNEKTVVNYSDMANFSPREFHEQNRTITILNNTVKSEKSSKTIFNILNFWNGHFKKVGTFSQDYQLKFSVNEIKMTDDQHSVVTGNNLPKSLCSQLCEECEQPEFRGRIAYIPGDILLLGIFSMHDSDTGFECGEFRKDSTDAIASEAFLYTIKNLQKINPNITVGGIVIDDCYNSIQTTMNITMILSGKKKLFDPKTGDIIDTKKIVAVIGPLSSGVAKSVADILTHEKMLMISYAASSYDLDDRISYPYFLRTVPSDVQQVNAIVALLEKLKWRYVGMIYCNNNYGAKAKELFLSSTQKSRICVPTPKSIAESSEKARSSELENILDELMKDQVKIVVYFGTISRVNDLVQALKRKNMENVFVFIGSETWGTAQIADLQAVAGSLTLTLDGSKTADAGHFGEYLAKRTLSSATVNNRFFNMFWYNFHKCNPPNGFRNVYDRVCTGEERFTEADAKKLSRDQRSVLTMNAVQAVYEGIKEFQRTECMYIKEVPCDRYSTHVDKFVKIVKKIKLKGYDDPFQVFDKNGNGLNTFNIHNIQRKETEYFYEVVGKYNTEYNLALSMTRFRFYDRRLQQIPYVNVTCPYKCCDYVEAPSASTNLSQTSIRTVDTIILILLAFLFIFFIILGICFVIYYRNNRNRKPRSAFQNRQVGVVNRPDPNSISEKRPPIVYIRSEEGEEGLVTYQIVKAPKEGVDQLSPVSQTHSTPNHSRATKYSNSCFEPDDVFLFPETGSQCASSSYEEVASPAILEKRNVPPENHQTAKLPQIPNARYSTDTKTNRSNTLKEESLVI